MGRVKTCGHGRGKRKYSGRVTLEHSVRCMFFVVFAIDFTRFHGPSKMSTTGLCIKDWQSCHQRLTKVDKVGNSE